jgi:hypothetical protein
MLRFILEFKANYNRKIVGKVSYLLSKAKFHGSNYVLVQVLFNVIYKYNVTLSLCFVLFVLRVKCKLMLNKQ